MHEQSQVSSLQAPLAVSDKNCPYSLSEVHQPVLGSETTQTKGRNCNKCGKFFQFTKSVKGWRPARCKKCLARANRRWYSKSRGLRKHTRTCRACHQQKHVSEFNCYPTSQKTGYILHRWCADCEERKRAERQARKTATGRMITVGSARHRVIFESDSVFEDWYLRFLSATHCEATGIAFSDKSQSFRKVLDHDHETGKPRGFILHGLNLAIGNLQDSPALLRQAANYLEHHKIER